MSETIDFNTGAPRLQAQALSYYITPCPISSTGNYSTNVDIAAYEQRVRDLHRQQYGIVVPQSTRIVIGVGSTELIAAAYAAVAAVEGAARVRNYFPPPYYALHQRIAETLRNVTWDADHFAQTDGAGDANVINAVSPSNPASQLVSGADARAVWGPDGARAPYMVLDYVYDYSLFTGVRAPQNAWAWSFDGGDAGLMRLASYSKFGDAGARVGWLMTENAALADAAQAYVNTVSLGFPLVGADSCATILRRGPSHWGALYGALQSRRADLTRELHRLFPGEVVIPVPGANFSPFLYTAVSADWWRTKVNTLARSGVSFFDSPERSRVMLMGRNDEWARFIARVRALPVQI